MSEYANRALRDVITTLAAVEGFAEVLSTTTYRNSKKAKRNILAIGNQAHKALDIITEELDKEQMGGILRFANMHHLRLVPKYSPDAEKTCYSISAEELALLMGDAVSECQWCEKEGKDARRCKKRKALLSIGAIGLGEKDCPYSGGIEL
jgi:hypothetical protein